MIWVSVASTYLLQQREAQQGDFQGGYDGRPIMSVADQKVLWDGE